MAKRKAAPAKTTATPRKAAPKGKAAAPAKKPGQPKNALWQQFAGKIGNAWDENREHERQSGGFSKVKPAHSGAYYFQLSSLSLDFFKKGDDKGTPYLKYALTAVCNDDPDEGIEIDDEQFYLNYPLDDKEQFERDGKPVTRIMLAMESLQAFGIDTKVKFNPNLIPNWCKELSESQPIIIGYVQNKKKTGKKNANGKDEYENCDDFNEAHVQNLYLRDLVEPDIDAQIRSALADKSAD